MDSRLMFSLRSLRERLWIKPLGYAIFALVVVLGVRVAGRLELDEFVLDIERETIERLLSVISASMLGVATFAVASMVSAYASASSTATPRAFSLVVADSVSQSALSSFIGAFIFSVVGIVAVRMGYYARFERFLLFLLALAVLGWIVFTFVRWVDHIARLGRVRNTIDRVEEATSAALRSWGPSRALGGVAVEAPAAGGRAVHAASVGYVQHVDVAALQELAERLSAKLAVVSPPGSFASPSRPLLRVQAEGGEPAEFDEEEIADAFVIADARTFAQDPRLGLIALSEIASRALSSAVNDPGTAIEIIGRLVKIFCNWQQETLSAAEDSRCERVSIPALALEDLLDDAFLGIARDGAGSVEVGIRLQKGLAVLADLGDPELAEAARAQARRALDRSEREMTFPPDLERLRGAALAR